MNLVLSHSKYQNVLLSLLIISGSLKVFLTYYEFPIDITVLILGLVLIDFFYVLFTKKASLSLNKNSVFYIFTILLFYLIAVISLAFTPSFFLGIKKICLMLIPLIGFFYVRVIKILDLRVLYKILVYMAIPLAVWFIILKYFLWNNSPHFDFRTDAVRFNPLRNSYLSFGYLMGILSILSLKYSKIPFFVFLFATSIILGLGSRGAFVFLILSCFIVYFKQIYFFFKNLRIKKTILQIVVFSFIPIIGVLFFYHEKIKVLFDYGLIRFTSLINASEDESLLGRIDQYSYVFQEGLSFQGLSVGFGLGSFGLNYSNHFGLSHPHNIFLEAWYELGFFAMCLLVAFFVLPFFHLKRKQIFLALALFAFFNAMKTLSFSTDRNLFILFAILFFNKESYETYR
ncbi:O-antigen ligase family protein [Seonamhaeicola sp.]|uniref:O-antigen ligase family protein n=1 Tax=Seonamhaeicola sp. TaxID=1912245 RepID=UPI00260D46FF|nr:O-antigen ligase family protein [Seonamhaeicola sp.]